jgi:PKHD-type hydroxylase
MFKVLTNVLTAEELARIHALLSTVEFVDGAVTAGPAARNVKKNLQAGANQPGMEEARQLVSAALTRNEEFRNFALPLRIVPPLFSRYENGMRYGEHTDNAVIAGVRTDLAMTLFLVPPESYDGGELIMEADCDPRPVKLPANCAIVYSAASLHRVEPVTRGQRLAAVTWIQSTVADAAQREILADLSTVLRHVRKDAPNTRETLLLAKSRANLLRMWSSL